MNIKEKLLRIQSELKAPKSQYNNFGKYAYRSCEDILTAFKPLGVEHKATLFITDGIELIGDRYYVKATATLADTESDEVIGVSAYAREEENKKGQDSSQTTGSTSSYARKYALNGLLAIDDTKDSDATNMHGTEAKTVVKAKAKADPSKIVAYFDSIGVNESQLLNHMSIESVNDFTDEDIKYLREVSKGIIDCKIDKKVLLEKRK